jgi:hypothetical protein
MGTTIKDLFHVGYPGNITVPNLAKFIKPCNQQGQHRTPTTPMTEPLVGTPASAHFVPPEPNAIFCMVFCFTEAIGLYELIVAVNFMD